jgi:3-phenylpropionate/trans-cinnamate dioxygenase ferredoxin subunit
MMNDQWFDVTEEKDFKDNSRLATIVKGRPVLLFRQAGQVFAVEDRCPHLGCSLARGTLEAYILKCPCHDWTFDIRSGEFQYAREIKLTVYDCRVDSGKIVMKARRS